MYKWINYWRPFPLRETFRRFNGSVLHLSETLRVGGLVKLPLLIPQRTDRNLVGISIYILSPLRIQIRSPTHQCLD